MPPAAVVDAFLAPTTAHTRRVDIYEADGVTPWMLSAPTTDGSVSVDYSRDERRSVDLTFDNSDGSLIYDTSGFWYDKIIKVFRGCKYIDPNPVASSTVRQNLVPNPAFRATSTTVEVRRNLCTNPSFGAGATTGWVNYVGVGTLAAEAGAAYSGSYGLTATADGTNAVPRIAQSYAAAVAPGDSITLTARARLVAGSGWQPTAAPYFILRGANNAGGEWAIPYNPTTLVPDADGWYLVSMTAVAGSDSNGNLTINLGFSNGGVNPPATAKFQVDEVLVEKGAGSLAYFDGATPAAEGLTYAWTGAANASASTASGVKATGYANNDPTYFRPWTLPDPEGGGNILRILSAPTNPSPTAPYLSISPRVPAAPDQTVTFSFEARGYGVTPGRQFRVTLYPVDSGGNLLSGDAIAIIVNEPLTEEWTRYSGSITLPATTATMTPYMYPTGATAWKNGIDGIDLRRFMIEDGLAAGIYFDGSTTDTPTQVRSWDGAADASTSTETSTFYVSNPTDAFWETQIGEFMIDRITEPNFPNIIKVSGRDYTKKMLLSKFTAATGFNEGQSVDAVINTLASNAGIDAQKRLIPVTGKFLGRDFIFDAGTSRWEACKQIADAYGYELFFDAYGNLVMREYIDPTFGPLSYTFTTGSLGNMVSYEKTVNDSRLYNHILVTGEASDILSVSAESRNDNPSSPTNITLIGDRLYTYSSSFITTTQQAQDVADSFLAIHALQEYELNLSALMLPWLEVGEIVAFEDPKASAIQPDRFLLSTLTYPLALGAMSAVGKRVTIVG